MNRFTSLCVLTWATLVAGPSIGFASPPEAPEKAPAPTCSGAVAIDDGTVDSGYGFVPTATVGSYVQAFDRSQLTGTYLTSVCLCFLKTREDSDIDFEVVVYADENGRPGRQPIAAVPGRQSGVASKTAEAGAFVEVAMPNVPLPAGPVYIGARWNPSQEKFLFLCNDRSPGTAKTQAYFYEDRAPAWASVFDARDPIFKPHRAVMVRARTSTVPVPLSPAASGAPVPANP